MNPVYDHIAAMVIIGLIFVGAVVVLPALNMRDLLSMEQLRLRNTAINVLNSILLDAGYPNDWGLRVNGTFYFEADAVKRFGLASQATSNFYVLDADKVQRLNVNNPLGFISYNDARKLLNLKGYGFRLRIMPPFNVTNVDGTRIDEAHTPLTFLSSTTLNCAFKVSFLEGTPIPNAVVEGYIFYSKDKSFEISPIGPSYTDALGIFSKQITLNLESPDYVIVILRVTVSDAAAVLVTMSRDASVYVADINIVGDAVVLTKAKKPSNEDVKINQIFVYTSGGDLYSIYNGSNQDHFNTGSGQHALWSRTFDGLRQLNPLALIFDFWATENGRREIIVAGPYKNLLNYGVSSYGCSFSGNGGVVKLERAVVIAGAIYTFEFCIWRE